jgi:hypothetical protein
MFGYTPDLDGLILKGQTNVGTLRKLMAKLGKQALPKFLIDYIETVQPNGVGSLAIHKCSPIPKGKSYDQAAISRDKGVMGTSQREPDKFPKAVHHIKIFFQRIEKSPFVLQARG